MTAYDRRIYSGNAKPTTISANIGSGDTSIACGDLTGWPDGSTTKRAFATIEVDGNASQERITYTGKTANTLTGVVRGADDTSPATHIAGAQIIHSHSKTDLDEANAHVTDTTRNDHTQYLRTSDVFAGKLIGSVQYGASGGSAYTLNNGTLTVLDGTHLTLPFTIPASGAVIVRMAGVIAVTATDNTYTYLGILAHGTSTQKGQLLIVNRADRSFIGGFSVSQKITGLTPGAVTWDVAAVSQNGTTTIPTNDAPSIGSSGSPFLFEVYAA